MGRARCMVRCWALLTLLAAASGFTVDCDRDYADCARELSRLTEDDDPTTDSPGSAGDGSNKVITATEENKTETLKYPPQTIPKTNLSSSAKGRHLNISTDDLQLFANSIHNHTPGASSPVKKSVDLSDVSMEEDDFEFPPHTPKSEDSRIVNKAVPDSLGLLEPREPLDRVFGDEACMENGIAYKIEEKIDRGCDEICSCGSDGIWRCQPKCQQPFIRRGRRLSDPLCYETPVDECCSIVACSTSSESGLKTSALKTNDTAKVCRYGNSSYPPGHDWEVACEHRCNCGPNGIVTCKPRCEALLASEHCINVQDPQDSCCQVQVCDVTHDGHEHPDVSTAHTNMEDRMDRDFEDLQVSTTSLPKVQSTAPSSFRPTVQPTPPSLIGAVTFLKNSSVLVTLNRSNSSDSAFHLQLSSDGGVTLKDIELHNSLIDNLEEGKHYKIKVRETGEVYDFKIEAKEMNVKNTTSEKPVTTVETFINETTGGCVSEGVAYKIGDEFRIGCSELCECVGPNETECAELICPSHVGLELVSPTCVRWSPDPPEWVPTPPACCPTKMRCLSDGSCDYQGHKIPNWSEVPESLTGCELRCFCESGNLDCQNICSPLPPLPPQTLRCQHGFKPGAVNISSEDCCTQWGCVPIVSGATPGQSTPTKKMPAFIPTAPPEIHFPSDDDLDEFGHNNDIHRPLEPPAPPKTPPQFQLPSLLPAAGVEPVDNTKLTLRNLVSDSPNSVKILFELSSVLVGLKGSVDLRYTDQEDDDISHWYSQVFAPTDEILTTARLEFRLSGLKPSTLYKLRGKLYLHNLPLEPVSNVYTVRTLDAPQVVEEKRRPIETGLRVHNVNATAVQVSWRHFTEEELHYIDGIQVRYRPLEQPIFSMTELLHHWRVSVELTDLIPGAHYEASLVLVSPPRSPIELYDAKTVNFTTPFFYDMYNFSVTVDARRIGSEAVEVTWRGVPAPPERYVRVYRAAHKCDGNMAAAHAHREQDAFKLADRDQPPVILLSGLRSDSKCRVWLELFLTNGKVKISNVLDITTKQEDMENTIDNEVQASSVAGSRSGHTNGDYYSALVVVGVVAALGTLTSLLLLLVVMRRHRPHSVSITTVPSAPRAPSLPPYDNPAYKLELQQETMDL